MLAPRKKLWSTPTEVIDEAIQLLQPTSTDLVYDIGAGDGGFIIRCAQVTNATCEGVEIDESRAQEAITEIEARKLDPTRCRMVCGNALDIDYSKGTAFFLYLVPRGLRLIYPALQVIPHKIRVVTYMSPLQSLEPDRVVRVATAAHPEAQWPLYYYELPGAQETGTP